MLTINLEKSLIRNKRKLLTRDENLAIKQMDQVNKTDLQALREKLGMWNENAKTARNAKSKLNINNRFRADRVFHKDDIRKLCISYGLRFLPAHQFNGEIDFELPQKIKEFEAQYKQDVERYQSFIAAPEASFHLQQRPVDPLFFVKISEDYYFLLHKWGKDISVFRWLRNLFIRTTAKASLWILFFGFLGGSLFGILKPASLNVTPATTFNLGLIGGLMGAIMLVGTVVVIGLISLFFRDENAWPWPKGNNKKWDCQYSN